MLTVAAVGTVTEPAVAGGPRCGSISPRRRRKVLILEPEPAVATFFAVVELRLRDGRARVEREAEDLAILGFEDLVDGDEALLGLLPR